MVVCTLESAFPDLFRNPQSGDVREGGIAQICRKLRAKFARLLVFRFLHQRKGAQNCRKFVANLKSNSDNFMQVPLSQ